MAVSLASSVTVTRSPFAFRVFKTTRPRVFRRVRNTRLEGLRALFGETALTITFTFWPAFVLQVLAQSLVVPERLIPFGSFEQPTGRWTLLGCVERFVAAAFA